MHLNSYQVCHWSVDRSTSRVSLHKSSSLPYRMHSCGHCYQSRQASRNLGRSCNWAWYPRLGDGPSYVSVLPSNCSFSWRRLADYIIQGHRFNIFEDIGCTPATYYTWPIFPILYLPPIIVGLFSATYASMTIIAFYKNRSQFNALLSGNGNITANRFIRLMCLASVEILFNIPIALYVIILQSRVPLNPYISWENVHYDFSHVQQIPSLIWRSTLQEQIAVEMPRWATVFCAFVFFSFFGFADEAKKNYRYAFQSVAKRVGLSTGSSFGNGLSSSEFLDSNGYVKPSSYYSEAFCRLLPFF